ncbi:MAG: hypothetical protein CAPSK01_000212 [Candidatus Accumulibacter vicinus]|uniref:Uncharacterized protein n=1 Tax=Candidatus Accumulibacter vicinus TaxID=2954382 RepID=A0A084Y5R8_9PROT|nr:MAG: hypothetical protein CAPSK01_000212 [Candidatus Accumulibacter vicinus]
MLPLPYSVENMQVAVGQERGDHAALRRAFAIGFSTTYGLLHSVVVFADDRGFEPLLDEVQNPPIDNTLGHHGQ